MSKERPSIAFISRWRRCTIPPSALHKFAVLSATRKLFFSSRTAICGTVRTILRPMPAVSISDHAVLRAFLDKDRDLHIYELGDLDPFFFPHTRWYTREDALALLYTG